MKLVKSTSELSVTPDVEPVAQTPEQEADIVQQISEDLADMREAAGEFATIVMKNYIAMHLATSNVMVPTNPDDLTYYFNFTPDSYSFGEIEIAVNFSDAAVAEGCPKYHYITLDQADLAGEFLTAICSIAGEIALQQMAQVSGLPMNEGGLQVPAGAGGLVLPGDDAFRVEL